MKKLYYLPIALAALTLSSCSLDKEPLDTLAAENYFNNRAELQTFTNGFYADFPKAETLYGETADAIIPTGLTTEVMGTRSVPEKGTQGIRRCGPFFPCLFLL